MGDDSHDAFGLVGERIAGKYLIDQVVGEGGFGVVYRATHEGFDAPVAIKCLKLPPGVGPAAQRDLVAQLREEGRMLLRLSQRTAGIVQALDVGTHTTPAGLEVPFLVLEWLEGRTLADDLRARRRSGRPGRSLRAALDLLAPAASALAIAHAQKIAHRDIKPENLMLVGDGDRAALKVLDFGIAKILDDASSTADDAKTGGALMFSAGYAAPEQFQKSRGASGPWSDVFALALVFVEVASGKRPLAGNDFFAVFEKTADPAVRPTLRAVGFDAPEGVEGVLRRALAVDPRERFRDAASFWEALSKAVGEAPVEEVPAVDDATASLEDAAVSTEEFVDRQRLSSGKEPSRSPSSRTELGSQKTERATTRNPVVAPAPPSKPQTASRLPWVAAAGVIGAVAITVGVLATRHPAPATSATSAAPSASGSSAPADSPVSANADAAALYGEGLQAWRGGAPDAAVDSLEKAVGLDRGLAAGELRLALWTLSRSPAKARDHYDHARFHATSLGPKDASLLEAASFIMNQPEDPAKYAEKLGELSAQYPNDPEILALLAQASLHRYDYDAALVAADKVLAIDNGYIVGWVFRGEALAGKGDAAGRLESYDKCVRAEPRALECLLQVTNARSSMGQCSEMLDAAKRYVAVATTSARAYHVLAVALHATDAAPASVNDALDRSARLLGETDRARATPRDAAYLAVLDGDFTRALTLADQWGNAAETATDQNAHLEPAVLALDIDREIGRLDDATKRAQAIRAKMGAWTEPANGDWTLTLDRYPFFANEMKPEEFATARDAWFSTIRKKWSPSGQKADGEIDWSLWANGYGAVLTDKASAALAVDHLPAKNALLDSGRYASIDAMVGRAYALAEKFDLARPPLDRATKNCGFDLTDPILATHAWFDLGVALEGANDKDGARKAYQRVVARWGKANPPSLTATAATAHLAALDPQQ